MRKGNLIEDELTQSVIGAFFEVYNTLGFGFLEHVYIMALERELRGRGHDVAREVGVRVMYKGEHLATQRGGRSGSPFRSRAKILSAGPFKQTKNDCHGYG